uniref:Uncharacterized protein n=1 Tax=Tanacetum cinerariifolium TaxID=118510 RepID=A0A6L2KMI0_TANCI|nr:hypothetical protein [Tanacetum cinerariifolium]
MRNLVLAAQSSSAVASLCISSGNLSSLAVRSCSGSGNSSLPLGIPCVPRSEVFGLEALGAGLELLGVLVRRLVSIEVVSVSFEGESRSKSFGYKMNRHLSRMDDPNIPIEEYIRLEEEKAQKHGKVFNWKTAKYGRIWYDEDIHDLRSVENEFPSIVFNDSLTSNETLSCEPTVSSLNNEIDFRISFDESDDEDYTVVFNKNSFSYKIISTNDLKTDSEIDNEKVNKPLFLSPEPTVSCIDDLDFIKDFKNEFPAIVYNDALTSKSDFSTEPTLCPQHINKFDLKDETSLSEYDEVEQNVLYFNDLFPFNIVYLSDLKSDKDNDENEIDMI